MGRVQVNVEEMERSEPERNGGASRPVPAGGPQIPDPEVDGKPIRRRFRAGYKRRILSRPHVSDDNPYSEAQFKTLKYHPGFPDRFGSIEDARAFCQDFFFWYNCEHHHSGIGLLTPEVVHYRRADAFIGRRRNVLASAFKAHPERFARGLPMPPRMPEAAWIIKPKLESNQDRLAKTTSIPGAVRDGPEGERRSRIILESDFLNRAGEAGKTDGNDTKLQRQVSHFP